ncbi:MAG TPA: antibiotic biosynthesis monooxygenase [Ktedonobacteraceae bacterium]|nr:antibiotic biosynthesis monooxygenase [Ktedonobacteraceae bacterium]
MYAAIRQYSIKPKFINEVMQRIQGEFLHIINREPGFIAYYAIREENNHILTISIFETQAGAEGSTPLALEWVTRNLAGFVQGVPQTTVGRIFGSSFGPV